MELKDGANGVITFFINGNPVFNNGLRSIWRNYPDCIILDSWVFDSLISVDEYLQKLSEDLQLVIR